MLITYQKPFEGLAEITLNRPEKTNALNADMVQAFIQCLQQCHEDKTVKVVLLKGAGKHFCTGADIAWMQQMSTATHQANLADAMQLATLFKLIYTFSKPIIGLIHGNTMGGGIGLVACCDIVIAAESTTFCFSEVKWGLSPSVISPYIIRILGERIVRFYFLTAKKFTAMEAKSIQLIQEIVPEESLMNAGMNLAKLLLSHSADAMVETKKLIGYVSQETFSEKLTWFTAEHLAMMRSSDDAKEGLNSFLQKRPPIWK